MAFLRMFLSPLSLMKSVFVNWFAYGLAHYFFDSISAMRKPDPPPSPGPGCVLAPM